jgi:hypothetical protein
MVKNIILLLFLSSGLFSQNIYERNCVGCHKKLPTSLQRMFMNYLLVYGGEKNMKAGLKHYLEYPSKHISVMSDLFIDNYGIKAKTVLSSDEIDEALAIYWNKFKVFDKLK